jgi:hypothetical protein
MADLSGLKLKKLQQTDWENYPVGGEMLPPHDPGVYHLRVKECEFTAKDGFLMAAMIYAIEDPQTGRQTDVRDWLLTKPRETGKRKGTCKAGDFLKAIGSDATPGEDPQDWADAIEATKDAIVQARLDWSAYDKENDKELAGTYDDFPYATDPDGTIDRTTRLSFIEVKQKDGSAKRFRANQRIRFYLGQRG